jgi:hypothetical protein
MNLKLSHEVRGVANREEVLRANVPAPAVPAAALLGVCLVGPQAVGWAAGQPRIGQTSHALGCAAMGSAHSQIDTSPARATCTVLQLSGSRNAKNAACCRSPGGVQLLGEGPKWD